MILTPRLQKIAEIMPVGTRMVDIGTDHAKLPIYTVKNQINTTAIAADVNKGPLENADTNIRLHNLENKISTRLSNGLIKISKDEADVVVIAGMGGNLMINILDAEFDKTVALKTFILQPMTGQDELRKWLVSKKVSFISEHIVIEGSKFYEIMKIEFSNDSLNKCNYETEDIQYESGINMLKDEAYDQFINYKIKKYIQIYNKTKDLDNKIKSKEALKKIEQLKSLLK